MQDYSYGSVSVLGGMFLFEAQIVKNTVKSKMFSGLIYNNQDRHKTPI